MKHLSLCISILTITTGLLSACRHDKYAATEFMDLCETYSEIEIGNVTTVDTIHSFYDEFPVSIETVDDKIF